MTREEHIQYWRNTSDKDWDVCEILFQSGKFVYCLFFAHLSLEKLAKDLWVKNIKDEYPPKTHNVAFLLEKASVNLTAKQKDFILLMNDFQLEGRYPDYQQKIFQRFDQKKTNEILEEVKEIRSWLLSKLQ